MTKRQWRSGVGALGAITLALACAAAAQDASPPIAAGPGRLVTTVYRHTPKPVVDVAVEGEPVPIGATANHPFWSVDRRAFIPAGDLRPGERLQDADGYHVAVRGVTPRGPPEPVYNLEVDAEHVYRVGAGGLLVHNTCVHKGFDLNNVPYYGITDDFTARSSAHARSWRKMTPGKVKGLENLSRYNARCVEQAIISSKGLQSLSNAINSVSPKRSDYTKMLANGQQLLQALTNGNY